MKIALLHPRFFLKPNCLSFTFKNTPYFNTKTDSNILENHYLRNHVHYDDERDKTVFHNTTSDLQDQDQERLFGLRPVLSLCSQSLQHFCTNCVWNLSYNMHSFDLRLHAWESTRTKFCEKLPPRRQWKYCITWTWRLSLADCLRMCYSATRVQRHSLAQYRQQLSVRPSCHSWSHQTDIQRLSSCVSQPTHSLSYSQDLIHITGWTQNHWIVLPLTAPVHGL